MLFSIPNIFHVVQFISYVTGANMSAPLFKFIWRVWISCTLRSKWHKTFIFGVTISLSLFRFMHLFVTHRNVIDDLDDDSFLFNDTKEFEFLQNRKISNFNHSIIKRSKTPQINLLRWKILTTRGVGVPGDGRLKLAHAPPLSTPSLHGVNCHSNSGKSRKT